MTETKISTSWGHYPLTIRACRKCQRSKAPIRDTHIGDLCFVCWMGTASCPKCGNRVLGGLCDICSLAEQRETMILSSSAGKFMSEHGTGPFERAARSKKAKIDSGVKEPKKAPRHIVRSKTPNKSRKKKDG